MKMKLLILILLAGSMSACTWVELTPEAAEGVAVAKLSDVGSCKQLGKATVSVIDEVWFYTRKESLVSGELELLGMNSAAEMGGDTIVPMSKIIEGERVYNVYRCK